MARPNEQAMTTAFFAALDEIADSPPAPAPLPAPAPPDYDVGQYQPFRVDFELDGAGVSFAPGNLIHLDSLLVWAAASLSDRTANYRRDDAPADEVPLPLREVAVGPGLTVWAASAIFPLDDAGRVILYEQKRYNAGEAQWVRGSRTLLETTYKNRRDSFMLLLCRRMVAYGYGDVDAVAELLAPITGLGARRDHGHGKIISKTVTPCAEDWSIVDERGKAQRWLPDDNGFMLCRMKPPYWNRHNRVLRCEIGDDWLATENGLVYGGGVRGTAPAILDLAPQETGLHRGAYAALRRPARSAG